MPTQSSNSDQKSALIVRRTLPFLLLCIYSSLLSANFLNPSLERIGNCTEQGEILIEDLLDKSKSQYLYYFNVLDDTESYDSHLAKEIGANGFIFSFQTNETQAALDTKTIVTFRGSLYVRKPSIFEKFFSQRIASLFYEVTTNKGRFLLEKNAIDKNLYPVCKKARDFAED